MSQSSLVKDVLTSKICFGAIQLLLVFAIFGLITAGVNHQIEKTTLFYGFFALYSVASVYTFFMPWISIFPKIMLGISILFTGSVLISKAI